MTLHRTKMGALGLLLWATACGASHTDSNSNTNWLRQCAGSSDCSDDQICACGVCTVACVRNESCAMADAPDARCVRVDDAMCAVGAVQTGAVCAADCDDDSDCSGDLGCVRGSCLLVSPAGRDAAAPLVSDDAGDLASDKPDAVAPIEPSGGTRAPQLDGGAVQPTGPCDSVQCNNGSACWNGACLTLWSGAGCEPAPAQRRACGTSAECAQGSLCHIDGTCIEPGTCDRFGRTTLIDSADIVDVTVTSDAVYVFDYGTKDRLGNHQGDGAIARVPIDGGAAQTLVAGLDHPYSLAVDRDRLIWSQEDPFGRGELWSARRSDGASRVQWDRNGDPERASPGPVQFVHDVANVYFLADAGEGPLDLFRVVKETGAVEAMTTPDWMEPGRLGLDSQFVYVEQYPSLLPVPLAGASPLAVGAFVHEFAIGRDQVLVSSTQEGGIVALAKSDGRKTKLAVIEDEVGEAALMNVHRDHVYYLLQSGNAQALWRAPLSPGDAEQLTVLLGGPYDAVAVAVSDRGLFWTDEGRLLRQVIEDYAAGVTPAQGEAGAPCFGDLTCAGALTCLDMYCQ